MLRTDDNLPPSDGGAFIPKCTRENMFAPRAVIIVRRTYATRVGPPLAKV